MRNQKGFTLIEILASITIFSLLIILILQLTGNIQLFDQKEKIREQAIVIANDVLNDTLDEIASMETVPTVGSIQKKLKIDEYSVEVFDTDLHSSPHLPKAPTAITGVAQLQNGTNLLPRLIVVTVGWNE